MDAAIECRARMCRTLQTAGFEKDPDRVKRLSAAAVTLAEDYLREVRKLWGHQCVGGGCGGQRS